MTTIVKARYAGGVLTPLEPLDLEEGAEVTVSIDGGAAPSGGGFADIVRLAEELQEKMPADAWDDLPTDLATNKNHYLYGHPKKEGA